MDLSPNEDFSGLRAYIWPVYRCELRKLFPMLAMFFLISLNYNILRTMKDSLLVTAKGSGAEVIPFIKVWVMFPMALMITFVFTHLSNRLSQEKVFYCIFGSFLTFFFVFTFIIYPFRDTLHPHETADALQVMLPQGLKGLVAMFRYWTFTLFYVMSELWSNIILSLLFWGFANEITRISEAKRFYGLFGVGANFSGIAAGQISILLCRSQYNPRLPFGEDAWHQSLILLMSLILLVGILTLFIYRWMHRTILSDKRYYNPEREVVSKNKERSPRMSITENFRYILKSPYLTSIMLIVLSYNIVINLVEVLWKHQVKELYPNPGDYTVYMNQVTTIIGVIATLVAAFVSGNSIRRLGWSFTAMLAPMILLVTSVLFFGFFFLAPNIPVWMLGLPLLGSTPLAVVVFFGTMQNCLSRAAKYTVFDATRELAFVPLGSECKVRGKSAIDGVCSRLGKSGGSVVHQVLLLSCATITASAPYVAAILLIVNFIWLGATVALGRQFNALTDHEENSALSSKENHDLEDCVVST
ncbi:ADP,ATP carrier protein 1 [Chlamydiales bacterium SCGC AG-110-P3]|nr:ADP,ATP carrier protein 1 [Chlamydiales bacterium SCGC AG-110-P3]